MKHFLSVLALTLFLSSATFASFPVKNSSNTTENAATTNTAVSVEENSSANQVVEKRADKVEKIQDSSSKKATKGDNSTVAIILAVISVLILPFAWHNWYLGRTKIALWQTLMVFPGFILLGIPALISWIWQIVDLIRLIVNGELPS